MHDIVKKHLLKVSKGFSDTQESEGANLNKALLSALMNEDQSTKLSLCQDDLQALIRIAGSGLDSSADTHDRGNLDLKIQNNQNPIHKVTLKK